MEIAAFPEEQIHHLIKAGRMLDAWGIANSTGVPLEKWPKGAPRRAAARLANTLGAGRLGRTLDILNWRDHRDHPRYFFQALFGRIRHTPESTLIPEVLRFLKSHPDMRPERRADLLSFLGVMYSSCRDYERAFHSISEALEIRPGDSWTQVEYSSILEAADRYEDALAAAGEAVRIRPLYGPAVCQLANCLVHLGRDDEAIDLLEDADRRAQNAVFALRLQSLFGERENHTKGLWCLDRVEALSPLADVSLKKWIAGRRADFHYMAGDIDACIEWCDRKGDGFHKSMAARLREPGARERRRVRLNVPFIRQHHMTCAPATLASLAAYWNQSHDHLEIANAICHDGTPWHKQRQWALEHGFDAREFRLTKDVLRELIDRGLPFTLTTQAATSSHLQACIGYDERCGVVLLRDPTERHFGEMFVEPLLDSHPISGPRCMLMVPVAESHRLDGMILPDEAAYDAHHDLVVALDTHDRWKIEAALSALRAIAGDKPLALDGAERVAAWKGDAPGQLASVEAQLAVAPGYESVLLQKAYVLRRLGRWNDLRVFLERIVSGNADPIFVSELGELLMEDARLLPRAGFYLRKAVRQRRRDGRVYESLARCLSKQQRHEEAASLRRIASNLSPAFEPYAKAHFDSCRVLRRANEGIAFLEERTRRFGNKDGGPWITLAAALNQLNRDSEAGAVLERGAAARPDDGGFLLDAGSMMTAWGEPCRSKGLDLMKASRGRVPETRWLLETARAAGFLGRRAESMSCWRSLLRLQPGFMDAWSGLARSLAEEEGEDAAIALLDEATRDHPDLAGLWSLKAEWLAGTLRGPLESLDRLLVLDPSHLWAVRERAIRRLEAGDAKGAEQDSREGVALNPWSAEGHGILGSTLEKTGRKIEAAFCLRHAISLAIDYTFASRTLLDLADDRGDKLEAIRFIAAEMRRQVSNGEIVPCYQKLAWSLLDPPVLLKELQDFCEERPDLWQTWAARIEQAIRMRFDGEALAAAERLTESFPLLPRAWLELARVHRTRGDHEAEEQATARAVELSPGWDEAAREHAHVLEVLGRPDEAIKVLRRACQLDPLNGANRGCLADALRRLGHQREALDSLFAAFTSSPYYKWGWNQACRWSLADGRKQEMAEAIRAASERNGHNPAWWSIATDAWDELGEPAAALEAIKQGLALKPADPGLRDNLAYQLFTSKNTDEALDACGPVPGESEIPVNLLGRRAWILMHSGQPLKGIGEMKKLLDQEPDYGWGLGELATWYEDRSDWESLREHSIRWLRAYPGNCRALSCLGISERQLGNVEAARTAFARAHALEPDYVYAARQLLDIQMERGEFNDAASTLASLQHYAPSPWITCDAIELELKRKDIKAAFRIADTLLCDPAAGFDVIDYLEDLFKKHEVVTRFNNWIAAAVKTPPVMAPGALANWIGTLPVASLATTGYKRLLREPVGSPTRIEAWKALLNYSARNKLGDKVRKWSKRHRSELHPSGELWATTGQAFLSASLSREGVAWYADWKTRPHDLDLAFFINCAALYDSLPGEDRTCLLAAREIRAEGLRRLPENSSHAQVLRAGLALQLATDGEIEEARALIENLEEDRCNGYYAAMGRGARAIVATADGEDAAAKVNLLAALEELGTATRLGAVRHRARLLKTIATRLPWAKGSVRRLSKAWNFQKPRPAWLQQYLEGMHVLRWPAVILIIVIIRIIAILLEDS
jgi:cellulose synthase operon protein C